MARHACEHISHACGRGGGEERGEVKSFYIGLATAVHTTFADLIPLNRLEEEIFSELKEPNVIMQFLAGFFVVRYWFSDIWKSSGVVGNAVM